MRISLLALVAAVAFPVSVAAQAPTASAGASVPEYVTAAMNDPARGADKADDVRRKMAAVVTFAGVKPGDTVIELVPGGGYWTRVFSRVVGAKGHVYTLWPSEEAKYFGDSLTRWQHLSATPHYANVSVLEQPAIEVKVPAKADVVFTANNYHDYHDFGIDVARFDRHVFEALKPGGVFIVIDHSAPAGSGVSDTNTLHRIDPATVKQELEAAGFVFDGASPVLRNAEDPRNVPVFDKSVRGHTDQFIYRFRKPAG